MKYILSRGAERDLEEIWEYIAQDNIDAADRWIAKLFAAFAMLARSPGLGHNRTDLTDFRVLFWPWSLSDSVPRKGQTPGDCRGNSRGAGYSGVFA
jgi:plasmid stabilization system protein ParE